MRALSLPQQPTGEADTCYLHWPHALLTALRMQCTARMQSLAAGCCALQAHAPAACSQLGLPHPLLQTPCFNPQLLTAAVASSALMCHYNARQATTRDMRYHCYWQSYRLAGSEWQPPWPTRALRALRCACVLYACRL